MKKENVAPYQSSLKSYIHDISQHKVPTRDEQVELFKQLEAGDDSAYEKLVSSNLRLVVSIAKHYIKPGIDVELEDLIAEGNLGLMKAIDKFDWRRGVALSTYATWWIKQSIMRYLTNKSRTIRKPAHALDIDSRKRKFKAEYKKEFGEEPTDEEVMDGLGISERMHNATEFAAYDTISIHSPTFSAALSNSFGTGGSEDTLQDRIPDDETITPFENIERNELSGVIREALKMLTPKEEKIIRLRFGIVDAPDSDDIWPVTKQELARIKSGEGLTD